jgi:hypothetical protein
LCLQDWPGAEAAVDGAIRGFLKDHGLLIPTLYELLLAGNGMQAI